ncbi:MAG: aldehyde ferredoxin oxidoreductase [Burkholderiales bacterium]|nr:aldehyde ferredoxin oxidoreductase [Burkholderiales bacterium]
MSNIEKRYGFTGKGLRVNLTTGKITSEPTLPRFEKELGGAAIGYKVFWDEVPPETMPQDEANKIVISPGPLSGTGALCSSRTAITTLFPILYPRPMIASAHVGGDLGAKMKLAGWDYIIIEGKSEKPVYLYINNDKAELRDASKMWGTGTRRGTEAMAAETPQGTSISVIGIAGENLVPMSILINAKSHSAGGVGGVFGGKKLKGMAIYGDEPIHIKADPKAWQALVDRNIDIFGSLNQHVVPSAPNPLFEYYDPASRWNGMPGDVWRQANPPIVLGQDMRSPNKIAYRFDGASYFLGKKQGHKIKVRNNGCYACPLRCHAVMQDDSAAAKYNINKITENVCMTIVAPTIIFPKLAANPNLPESREAAMVGAQTIDDLGVWCNYGSLHRAFASFNKKGYIKKFLSEDEYKSYDWDKIDNCDASFLQDLLQAIAFRKGELGYWFGESTPYLLDHFKIPQKEWTTDPSLVYWALGHSKHHANEDDGQVGTLLNCLYNRDPMAHGTVNFTRCGLPLEEKQRIAEHFWGDKLAVDAIGDYTPTNPAKMKRLRYVISRKELHDMLGLCSWVAPYYVSPIKEEHYIGDMDIEAKLYNAVTGQSIPYEKLDDLGFRAWVLHRAYTMRELKELNMRKKHDIYPEWIFMDAKNIPAFTKGTIRMDRDDIEKSFDIFFEQNKFDKETGAPTAEAYKELELDYVIPVLEKDGLMPGKKQA